MKKLLFTLMVLISLPFASNAQSGLTVTSNTASLDDVNNTVTINWTATSPENIKFFWVEYSLNGSVWSVIAQVSSGVTGDGGYEYTFTHNSPAKGKIYYRLMQMNFDGTNGFTQKIMVTNNKRVAEQCYAYPNPVTGGDLTVMLRANALVEMYSISGIRVYQASLNTGLQHINVSSYRKGIYILRVGAETLQVDVQ